MRFFAWIFLCLCILVLSGCSEEAVTETELEQALLDWVQRDGLWWHVHEVAERTWHTHPAGQWPMIVPAIETMPLITKSGVYEISPGIEIVYIVEHTGVNAVWGVSMVFDNRSDRVYRTGGFATFPRGES